MSDLDPNANEGDTTGVIVAIDQIPGALEPEPRKIVNIMVAKITAWLEVAADFSPNNTDDSTLDLRKTMALSLLADVGVSDVTLIPELIIESQKQGTAGLTNVLQILNTALNTPNEN